MKISQLRSRVKTITKAWPLPALVFILLSFALTVVRLLDSISTLREGLDLSWLEPLAAILGGLGAFMLAAILIFRRVDSAREEAGSYHLARGLATGYYFNFVRPLVSALRDPNHALHQQVASLGGHQAVGLVIGVPESVADFDPARHNAFGLMR